MKTIAELRTVLKFHPQEINSSISYFAENCKIDYNVYLPTKGKYLQRDFCWSLEQKRELIWSILMKRFIQRLAMINTKNGIYQIIDGKQRLSTMIDFYNNKFTLLIDDSELFFNQLPSDYQNVIGHYMFAYYIVNEDFDYQYSDEDKINWFKFINFAGTPQDTEHFKSLE